MLATELGIEPSPELRELERRMLQQDPTLVPNRRRAAMAWKPKRWTFATRTPRRGACFSA
jgi:DNA-binding SARP family transcriptional activator